MKKYTKEDILKRGKTAMGKELSQGEECTNCTNCTDCDNCVWCTNCTNCASCCNCTDCDNCAWCYNCIDCDDCTNCANCYFSENLKNKKYVVYNVQLTEAEYKEWVKA